MKNFIGKSLVVALMVLPLLSHARDCGLHTVLNIHQGSWGSVLFAVKNLDGTVVKYVRPNLSIFNTSDKVRTLTTMVIYAKASDTSVRLTVDKDGSCSLGEYHIVNLGLE